jgi:hypothetical protein
LHALLSVPFILSTCLCLTICLSNNIHCSCMMADIQKPKALLSA